ncbi:hypothetical protein CKM354_000013400 [Cercospora kikuchii]|uniref:RING-type domain-containing protein n=1 Tax=Cercospora kikuchii TaxID=84275 RepID=A0A9P3CA83_9PEZI|nr:uncharacterized protein CKM354_000013400 [Cercospora kikuchii]GIZ36665.1 hypothetical protein CKM354_000013400 [Cercospora kikuchii]
MSVPTRAEYLRGLVPLPLPFQPPNVDDGEDVECPICRVPYEDEPSTQIVETVCKHKFCYDCLLSWNQEHSSCPTCRKELYEPESGAEDFADFPIEAMEMIEVIEQAMALMEFREDRVGHDDRDIQSFLEAHNNQRNVSDVNQHEAERAAAAGRDAYRPVILEAGYLWRRLMTQIQLLHEWNESWILAELPIEPEPVPEMPEFIQELMGYDARCSFSCHDAGLTYEFDRLSVRGEAAGEDAWDSPAHPLYIFAQAARSYFNSPECEQVITTIAHSANRRGEGMSAELDVCFSGTGPVAPASEQPTG